MSGFKHIDNLAKILDIKPYESTGDGGYAYVLEGEDGAVYDLFELLTGFLEKAEEQIKEIVK